MSIFKTLLFSFFSISLLVGAELSLSQEHHIEYSKHSTLEEALSACAQLFYDIGADQFYNSPSCGWNYVPEGDSSLDLLAEGTAFYRVTGGNWCTARSGRTCLGDYYFFYGVSPGYFLASSTKSVSECEGNPCDPVSGRKIQSELDFSLPDSNLRLVRYYSSWPSYDGNSDLSIHWRHNFSAIMDFAADSKGGDIYPVIKSSSASTPESACINRWDQIKDRVFLGAFKNAAVSYDGGSCVATTTSGASVTVPVQKTFQVKSSYSNPRVINSQGVVYDFVSAGNGWREANSAKVSIEKIGNEWHFIDENKNRHVFVDGVLDQLKYPGGETINLSYDDQGLLVKAENNKGMTIAFSYTDERLTSIDTPSGVIQYLYQDLNLVQVIYQDGSSRQYHYEDSRFPSHLTGITNENGDRYANWAYDSSGRVILSEHAGGAERYEFEYSSTDGTTRVTGPAGDQRTYQVSAQQGGARVSDISGDRCQTCPNSQYQHRTYDNNGYLASATDWNGVTTHFVHDDRGLELSRTEAAGTPQARTIETQWHPTLRLPVRMTTPTTITELTYDEQGNRLSRTQSPR